MTPRPAIFISAVSKELMTARQLVANTLSFLGYEPVWQDIFGTEQGDLRGMLRRKIDECKGVVQLVGRRYGAEPPLPDEHFGRVSYTQYEVLYARQQGKKIWFLVMDEKFPVEHADPEPLELQELQAAYLRRLQADTQLYHPLATPEALESSVLKLRDDLTRLRRGIKQWAVAVLILLLLVAAGIVLLNQKVEDIASLLRQGAPPVPTGASALPPSTADPQYSPPAYGQTSSPAKAAPSSNPQLAFAVLGLGDHATNWASLGPSSSLLSGEHFFIRAETFTPGFLYIFLVDSSDTLYWLFPANSVYSNSFGLNPLPARVAVTLPPGNAQAFRLDTTVGEERVFAIFSATRWPALELALHHAGGLLSNESQNEIKTLLASDSAVEDRAKGIARVELATVEKDTRQATARGHESYLVALPPDTVKANGHWLLQVRRFRHLPAAPSHP